MGGVRANPFSREREEGGRRRRNMASTTFDLPSTNLDSDMASTTFDWHIFKGQKIVAHNQYCWMAVEQKVFSCRSESSNK